MSFTWIPLYKELATRLLAYEHRQDELLALLAELKAADLPVVKLDDKEGGVSKPLSVMDPFTFFATFNRRITDDNRKAILERLRDYFGATAPIPDDFDGIPLADNMQSWFFPWADQREGDDIASLWALARQAVEGGRQEVEASTFDRCLRIRSIGISKLTFGLFWMRPDAFLSMDGQSQGYLTRKGIQVPSTVDSWDVYQGIWDATAAALGQDFQQIALDAYLVQEAGQRCWAGGHQFGDESKLDEFIEQHVWYIGWEKDATSKGAKGAWKRIPQIKPGDLFAIKGHGGTNHLRVYAVGEVLTVDAEAGRLSWKPRKDIPLFRGKAPGKPGDGTFWETLCEVSQPKAKAAIFNPAPATIYDPPPPTIHSRPDQSLNLILHGPPGTGKTWSMRQMREDFRLNPAETDRAPDVDVADLTWFEVVALALHDLGKPSEANLITRHPLVQAKYVERAPRTKLSAFVWNQLQSHTIKASKTVKYEFRTGTLVFDCDAERKWHLPKGLPEDLLAKAGTGQASSRAPRMENQYFVTFHPSFTYEDFVEGIRAEQDEDGDENVRYPLRAGIFKQACERAVQLAGFKDGLAAFCALTPEERRTTLDNAPPAVLFIDEINRGNVARIFGELITLIEPDKRLGEPEELIVTLPGSRHLFGVPSNLWLIGTMNTADRSVVALDTALRRRFAFRECPPDPTLLEGVEVEGVDIRQLLETINDRLLVLRDRDHLVGHSFFWGMRQDESKRTIAELQRVFRDSILPLLVEYFHDDLGRVGLVLGSAFVTKRKGGVKLAKFDHDQAEDLADMPVWNLEPIDKLGIDAFRGIYA